jgi:hypothetical protein
VSAPRATGRVLLAACAALVVAGCSGQEFTAEEIDLSRVDACDLLTHDQAEKHGYDGHSTGSEKLGLALENGRENHCRWMHPDSPGSPLVVRIERDKGFDDHWDENPDGERITVSGYPAILSPTKIVIAVSPDAGLIHVDGLSGGLPKIARDVLSHLT